VDWSEYMEWLYILLTILRFIGLTLIFLIIALIFLFLVLLFGRIKYYVFVEKKESYYVRVKVSFIKIVKFVFLIDDDVNKSYIQILFFKFLKRGFSKVKSVKTKPGEKSGDEFEKVFEKESSNEYEKTVDFSDKKIINEGKNTKGNAFTKERYSEDEKKHYSGEKLNNILSNAKNIYNKFLYLKNYPERDKIIRYTFNFVKELFFAVKPKNFKADLLVGFDDPSSTGKFIGFMAIVSEFLPFRICFSGDFENEVFQCCLEVKGKTNILKIGIPTLKYIFKDPIWKLIKNRKG